MRGFPNIEKSAFRKGEYVGYADGVWAIRRTNSTYGKWIAMRRTGDIHAAPVYAWRLSDLSEKLAAVTEAAS